MEQAGFQIGAYSVLSRLGVGGMGEVWLATRHGRQCVVKTLLPHLADDERVREMFLKEGRVAAMISDPSVVQIYELGTAGGRYFMALEYVDGVSLDRLLGSRKKLSPLVAAYIAARASAGLQAIHEQAKPDTNEPLRIVHRDISPSNLLLSIEGDVKVSDFGIAKTSTTDPRGATTHGTAKGKIAYMSPEQARGETVDQRTDLFALGVVMYELIAGDLPYQRSNNDYEMLSQVVYGRRKPLQTLAPDVPPVLAEIIERTLAREPDGRFANARELRVQLDAWLEQQGGVEAAREELATAVRAVRTTRAPAGPPETRAVGAVPAQTAPSTRVPSDPAVPVVEGVLEPTLMSPRRRARLRNTVIGAALATLASISVTFAIVDSDPEPSPPGENRTGDADPDPQLGDTAETADESLEDGPDDAVEEAPPGPGRTPPTGTRHRKRAKRAARTHKAPEQLVAVDVQPAVDVYAGAKLLGHTPLSVPASAAQSGLRLVSAADGIDYDYRLEAAAPQPFTVPRGMLHVRVDPWAEVTLDGRALGITPIAPLAVYAGRHVIDLVNDEKKARRRVEVLVTPNQTTVVREKL